MRRLYQLCLQAYPPDFRARHGAEMQRIVDGEWCAARERGWRDVLGVSMRILADLIRTAPHERLHALRRNDCLALSTAIGGGIVATAVHLAAREMAATLLVYFVVAGYFSYFAARRTWRWPLGVVMWLPLTQGFVYGWDVVSTAQVQNRPTEWLIFPMALATTFTGAFLGVAVRQVTANFSVRQNCIDTSLHRR